MPKRHLKLALPLVFIAGSLGVLVWLGGDDSVGTHPRFGPIYAATASEGDASPLVQFARRHVPRSILRSRYFPSRLKGQPSYLELGRFHMEWSSAGDRAGWLYFWDLSYPSSLLAWEFAPCVETDLMKVSAIPSAREFVGPSNPAGCQAFGFGSGTNAINVYAGQIVFARRALETNRVYIIEFQKAEQTRTLVHYCVAPSPQPDL